VGPTEGPPARPLPPPGSAPDRGPHAGAPRLSVAVLTLNEAHGIRRCLRSAAFADEVVVVDSGSTDETVAIARAEGAQVFVHPDWQGFAVQRDRLLAHVTGDYVFFLDADETITPALQGELQEVVRSAASGVWRVRWRTVAFGQELKFFRSQSKPERLFERAVLVGFDGVVHERARLDPPGVQRHLLRGRLLHHSRETVRGSLAKLTQYAMLGAAKRARLGQRGGVLRGLASGVSMFLRLYLLHLGFLCGAAGFLYCVFAALESFLRYAALRFDRDHLTDTAGR
jgi:glycosyltransferase involved in cell wall biosynthesis